MPRFLKIAGRDARNTFKNTIALVVCVGMIVIPCFYAWFNIWGSWDPYGNTKNLKVALVNNDDGYKSDLIPVNVNLGQEVVGDLRASKSIGYIVTDEDDALEGVKSGAYYAAVVIPDDFSERMLTSFAEDGEHPEVTFYQNEKANAIASIVTDKASAAVKKEIDQSFASSLTSAAAGVLDQLGTYLDSDDVAKVAAQLDRALDTTQARLSDTAGNLRSYAAIAGSAADLLAKLDTGGASSLSSALDATGLLGSAADGTRSLSSALDGATADLNSSLASSKDDLEAVRTSLGDAFDAADTHAQQMADALAKAKEVTFARKQKLQELLDSMKGTDEIVKTYEKSYTEGSAEYQSVHSISIEISGLNKKVQQALDDATKLDDTVGKAISDLESGRSTAKSTRASIEASIAQAQTSFDEISSSYEQGLKSSLAGLGASLSSAASEAESVGADISSVTDSLSSSASSAADGLSGTQKSLTDAASTLDDAAAQLERVHTELQDALSAGDLEKLRQILSADATDLATFISAPVSMDRTAVFAVANNGSAMAPFYTTLAIWIGGVVLCALVKCAPSEKYLKEIGARPTDAYLGRLVFFLVIGFLQSSLVLAGDLWFLGVQCTHPALFFLTGWLESFIFINIIYALTASFGDVGKAIAVVLMVIQVAGSGGTFPKEMLPGIFQKLYPFLPFVHGEDALRAAIAGIYQNDYWFCMLRLAAFIVPALLLGLVLRRPVIHLNHWVEGKLESTKIM